MVHHHVLVGKFYLFVEVDKIKKRFFFVFFFFLPFKKELGRVKCEIVTQKITSKVNFTNILRAVFSYESFAQSFFVLEVKVKFFIGVRKLAQLRS